MQRTRCAVHWMGGLSHNSRRRKRTQMTPYELQQLIRDGEDSGLEFKRDEVTNFDLAREVTAFLNHMGGTVLLGVDDGGRIVGAQRPRLEEWVVELCRAKIDPPVIPSLHWVRNAEPGSDVLAVRVSVGPDKPYARVHNKRRTYYVRVGSTSREASSEELERMYQSAGRLNYGVKPVPGAGVEELDLRRLRDYLTRVLGGSAPDDDDTNEWGTLLHNLEFVTQTPEGLVATVDGMLLFGTRPRRFLPQSGIRAICYPSLAPDYATRADQDLHGPIVPLVGIDGYLLDPSLVDKAWDFVRLNTTPTARLDGMRRVDRWPFPEAVVRECIANALAHRDYSIRGTDITLNAFPDRLEIESPGSLPNTITVERMRAGVRYARNQTLMNVMRDYGYVDARGMGIRNKVVPGMLAHNGTEPEFMAEEHRLTVRLRDDPQAVPR
ncbi:MAG: ATP-dependent DNA helicase RecG [Gammaproteobacteria bacterium]|nr:ATP-dependent DNA helicase RecG [Gammaproteobacteria bacterium]